MTTRTPRDFSKRKDGLRIPDLVRVQRDAYARFLQLDTPIEDRRGEYGLEGLLREVFPIESYDGSMRLEYVSYSLDEPRYTPDECRELRLTYGMPFVHSVRNSNPCTISFFATEQCQLVHTGSHHNLRPNGTNVST